MANPRALSIIVKMTATITPDVMLLSRLPIA
jgi:hypothetical protein